MLQNLFSNFNITNILHIAEGKWYTKVASNNNWLYKQQWDIYLPHTAKLSHFDWEVVIYRKAFAVACL